MATITATENGVIVKNSEQAFFISRASLCIDADSRRLAIYSGGRLVCATDCTLCTINGKQFGSNFEALEELTATKGTASKFKFWQ